MDAAPLIGGGRTADDGDGEKQQRRRMCRRESRSQQKGWECEGVDGIGEGEEMIGGQRESVMFEA